MRNKSLTKEDLCKLPLVDRYKLFKLPSSTYEKHNYYIITPNLLNKYTNEQNFVMKFSKTGLLGCCGSSVIGEMRYYSNSIIKDTKEDKEYIMNLMLNSSNTNNIIISDVLDVAEESSMCKLIELVQPELKPVDSYFNENSGNTVVLYSYNKSK